ncbi:PspC domain-containing protein [Xylanivirga thermophila]|uniref:PspC domain-containing protein n=1 Tax=Xylanivirga thermophila TaxID=2496273 RepID=UPI00101BC852|nr:PspC domain-containing protein [Xylanivirga thermophila]
MYEKKLYKSRKDRKICGVCGGFAEFFGIDSTWIRIIWIIFSCIYGAGILAYFLIALAMPNKLEEW